ncbi:MAG: DinB family protein [Streptosporangiaceae bacterium]
MTTEQASNSPAGPSRAAGSTPGRDAAGGASPGERADLLEMLASHRNLLRRTVRDLTDEQAAQRTTVSELCLGGIIKHVSKVERRWARFITEGPAAMTEGGSADPQAWANTFRMLPSETLAGLLAQYEEAAAQTDELVRSLPDLGAAQPLPPAPWFPPGTAWSARRVLMHVIAETAQHAGHADILRESLDGAKSMG